MIICEKLFYQNKYIYKHIYSVKVHMRLVFRIEDGIFDALLLIFNIILYIKIANVMKNNLNHYFIKNGNDLAFLFEVTSAYFISKFFLNAIKICFNIKESKLNGISMNVYSDFIRIIFLIMILFVNLLKFLYAFYSFKGVNFKLWTWNIFDGYKILHLYPQSSIFIFENRFELNTTNSTNLLVTPGSTNSDKSNLSENRSIDYEVNDDYMKNYKLNYLTDKSSSRPDSSYDKSLI